MRLHISLSALMLVGVCGPLLAQYPPISPNPQPFSVALQAPQEPVLPQPQFVQDKGKQPTGVPATAENRLELVEFRDLPLKEAMRLLSQQSGIKVAASKKAGDMKVSLYLKDVVPSVAVSTVAAANGLIVRKDAETGIYRIMTPDENQRALSDFRDEITNVFTLHYPNALNVATAIRDLFGPRVVMGQGSNPYQDIIELQARFNRFDLLNQRTLGLGLPTGTNGTGLTGFGSGISGIGGFGVGGGTGGISGIGGGFGGLGSGFGGTGGGLGLGQFGNITGLGMGSQTGRSYGFMQPIPIDQRNIGLTPEEMQKLDDAFTSKEGVDRTVLLELLRHQPANIYVTVIKPNNQLVVRTGDPNIMAQIADLVCKLDVPTPVVLLEVKILSINLQDDFTSVFNYQFTDGVLTSGGFTTSGNQIVPPLANILPPLADLLSPANRRQTGINAGVQNASGIVVPNTTPGNQMMFEIVSANFRARLQLLEDRNRVTALATPLIMTANNEVSQIFSGQQIPITTGFTAPQSVTPGTGATTTVASVANTTLQNIGNSLIITPNINADRTVTLRLLQESSSVIKNGGVIPVPSSDGTTVTQVPIDIVQRQTVSGTVVAKDGLTIAIGGLITEQVNDSRQQLPVLGRIPYLGTLFRQQQSTRQRNEVVVLIRPFVLSTSVESAAMTKNLIDSVSIHPNVQQGDFTNMGTFLPSEVLRPNPPITDCQRLFQVHTVRPTNN